MEESPLTKRLIYLLFALSGSCALIYEVLWTKYLSLTFGTTMVAVSVVAATFMGGLALGSFLLGRFADHETNLLRTYAFLELGIALTALLFAPTLGVIEQLYVWLRQASTLPGGLVMLTHLLFSAILLLPPTICMGGTFPLMCRFFARRKSGGQIGRLYALNTLGATLGALLAGYLLIPTLGLSLTGYLAIAGNLLIAATTFLLSRGAGHAPARSDLQAGHPKEHLRASEYRPILVAIGLIGFFSLSYEMLWTRVLLLFLGNTTYAFSLMLGAYLVGIALGGAIYARKVRPNLNEKQLFVVLGILMGVSILAMAPFYDQLAHFFQLAHEISGEQWWLLSALSFAIVLAMMIVPTIISGSLLPAAVAIIDPGKGKTGQGVGLVVLYNTVGAVFGSLVAGFLLVPALGLLGSFRLLALGNILLGIALCYHYRAAIRVPMRIPALAALGVALSFVPADWDEILMNSGVYCYAPKIAEAGGIRRALSQERILAAYEGVETTVAVKERIDGSVRYFAVNGKTDGGNGQDMATQVLVGLLPVALHPDPQEVMVIGYGSGITVGAVKELPIARIDCAEISPEVVKAADYFAKENRNALQDPRVRLFIEDGRNLLFTRENRYDVIVSEPSNPWQAGNANLFTDDFYRLAASRLKVGGIFCQWIGLYDITTDNLKIAVGTLLHTFPNVQAFKVGADLVLVGSRDEVSIDYMRMTAMMRRPGVRETLAGIKVHSAADLIARHHLASEATLGNFAGHTPYNSDDHNVLEYSAHFNLGDKAFGEMQMANTMALTKAMEPETMPIINLGMTMPEVRDTLLALGKAYYRAGYREKATFFMRKAAEYAQAGEGAAAPAGESPANGNG